MAAHEHLSGGQLWLVQPNDRTFSPETATSQEWGNAKGPVDKGYSSFDNPHDLVRYFNPSDRAYIRGTAHVVNFTGEQVGHGMEGEPLAVPDMKVARKMSWDDLEKHVGKDFVHKVDRSNDWLGEQWQS